MPLTGQQISVLANTVNDESDSPTLDLIMSDLGLNPNDYPQGLPLKQRATALLAALIGSMPPRDSDFLKMLRFRGNANIKRVVDAITKPAYFPPGDPHDAIVIGRTAFVDRAGLRAEVRQFTEAVNSNSTRVLVVRGEEPGGKSYSWQYLRHLSWTTVGATAQRLPLKRTNYTPRQFMEQVYSLLLLELSKLPMLPDDPQLAKIDPLINAFTGQLQNLSKRYWLVIDDLNDPAVTPAVRDTAYALARTVEDNKPDNLWIALLGYNEPISDPELRHIAKDDAEFPTRSYVAKYFEEMAKIGGNPLAEGRATEITDVLFTKYARLNKEAMEDLTRSVEDIGEKLKAGQQI